MTKKRLPYLLSISVHLVLALIFFLIKISLDPIQDEYVTIGFGAIGKASSSGVLAKTPSEEIRKKQPEAQKEVAKKVVKKVELPKVENLDEDNDAVVSADEKENEEEAKPEKIEPIVEPEEETGKGQDISGEGEGNFGFEIDFGGKGMRKIYSYTLPAYPEGVSKEIDVKLKFSILSDGTVGKILPLIKADTRLELVAINSLRQWRFEPLPESEQSKEQFAVIIFPFRLK